ncbi:MAG: PxKF domain-containing protein [bacterium]|nr:PxKF domain-containing protein [bacterium]
MKNILLAAAFLFSAAFPLPAIATTYFSGVIEGDVVWTKEESPYVVSSVTIPTGSSLTILPGVVVKVEDDRSPFTVYGTLNIGLPDSPSGTLFAAITSIHDDSIGGDTNGDGSATTPHPGIWRNVTAEYGGIVSITRTAVRYGGALAGYDHICRAYCGYTYFTESQLVNHGGTLTVNSSSFDHTLYAHIEQSSGSTTVADTDLVGAPLALLAGGGSLSLLRNHFFSNTRGFNMYRTTLALASNIFIETPTNDFDTNAAYSSDGMNRAAGETGTMLRVSGTLDGRSLTLPEDGFTYVLAGINIMPSGALTILPGAIVKMHLGTSVIVSGSLTLGDSASPLWTLVTSLADDSVGGDTNGDGAATTPAQGDWSTITAKDGGTVSLTKTALRYGGREYIYGSFCRALCGHLAVSSQLFNQGGMLTVLDGRLSFAPSHIDTYGGTTTIAHTDLIGTRYGALNIIAGALAMEGSSVHDLALGTAGINASGGTTVGAIGNWWGSATGPTHVLNASGTGAIIDGEVSYTPWLTEAPDLAEPIFIQPATTTVPARRATTTSAMCIENCNSNVLFLPGAEASRLYRPDYDGGTDQLWEPNAESDVSDLFLTDTGASIRSDIYTKDVIDEVNIAPIIRPNVYKSFLADLDAWKNDDHLIADYAVVPYDWRVDLEDLLESGHNVNGRIYYSGDLAATTTPFIIQELHRLAASSRTGKVTIVTHSNGGLLAKVLTQKLGASEAARLIDKIIFVGVPQAGTPQAIGALLHGYDQGLPKDWFSPFLSPEVARAFVKNTPIYNLLPSADYFTFVDTPVARFDDSPVLAEFRARYGNSIQSSDALRNFVTDTRRLASSTPDDLAYPSVGNSVLYSSAETLHEMLDGWIPPDGVELYEIAGWGEDTLATIEYHSERYCERVASVVIQGRTNYYCAEWGSRISYNPYEVVDGDGTVVTPSALWMPTSTGVAKYWVNLREYDRPFVVERKHADIFEVPELRMLTKNIVTGSENPSFEFISITQPVAEVDDDRLRFVLHSPLHLSAIDADGNIVNSATSTIPGSRYKRYGEVQVLSVPLHTPVTLHLDGYASGSFTLDVAEIDGNNITTSSTTILAIPSSTSTVATMSFSDGTLINAAPLVVDYDGDTITDFSLAPVIGETITLPPPPPVYNFSGFLQPINDTAYHPELVPSVFKGGSTIPVKFQLKNGDGVFIQASTSPRWLTPELLVPMSSTADEPVSTASATNGDAYRWDSTDQQYLYNWSTKEVLRGYWYRIFAKLDDGETYSVVVGLR